MRLEITYPSLLGRLNAPFQTAEVSWIRMKVNVRGAEGLNMLLRLLSCLFSDAVDVEEAFRLRLAEGALDVGRAAAPVGTYAARPKSEREVLFETVTYFSREWIKSEAMIVSLRNESLERRCRSLEFNGGGRCSCLFGACGRARVRIDSRRRSARRNDWRLMKNCSWSFRYNLRFQCSAKSCINGLTSLYARSR